MDTYPYFPSAMRHWLLAVPIGCAIRNPQRAIRNTPHAFLTILSLALALVSLIPCRANAADDAFDDRLSLSPRFGFGISAHFKGVSVVPVPASTRKTPGGDAYNYDDGYVLTDNTGNFGGQTWYWGYDSASQISENNILLGRNTSASIGSPNSEDSPGYGGELLYTRMLGANDSGRLRYGFEAAVNYLNFSVSDNRSYAAGVTRQTDTFPFTPGTTPPGATPSNPYQGSSQGPGFVISDTPVSSSTAAAPGMGVSKGNRDFDANIWGIRLGPSLEFAVNNSLKLGLSGGFAAALVDADASWSETIIISGASAPTIRGSGHNSDIVLGGYVAANVAWELSERWSLVGSAQYQYLSSYEHSFGGRSVELDLTHGFFITLGVGYKF